MKVTVFKKLIKEITIVLAACSSALCSDQITITGNTIDCHQKRIMNPSVATRLKNTASLPLKDVCAFTKKQFEADPPIINLGLDLSSNYIGDEGAEFLKWSLKGDIPLKWIDLSFNRITPEGLKKMINILIKNKDIYISISGNPAASVDGKALLNSLKEDILKRLILVNQKNLYRSNWEVLVKDHPQYDSEFVNGLRESYQQFFDLKSGEPFATSSYNESEDINGDKANVIGNKMAEMGRYKDAKDWYEKAVKKDHASAPYRLAQLYAHNHLISDNSDNEENYLKYLKLASDKDNLTARNEYEYYLENFNDDHF